MQIGGERELDTSSFDDLENVEAGAPRLWLPPGLYPAKWVSKSNRRFIWGEKMIVEWKVFTSLDYRRHVNLARFYNLDRNKAGRYKIGDGHGYRKDWIAAHGGRPPSSRERIPMTIFQNGLFLVAVVTVTRDTHRPLPTGSHWSKIGYVVRPLEENEKFEGLPLELPETSKQIT